MESINQSHAKAKSSEEKRLAKIKKLKWDIR